MKKTGFAVLMALLCLPIGAKAVREGVVENAPMVEVRETASYLPSVRQEKAETDWMLEEAYTEIDTTEMMYADIGRWLTSNCRLTMGERKRMEKLMAAYAAGERTGDGASVLEAKKRVRVGVYALDPKEYDGERVLLLLPGNCLTDEEMLAILDAYHQLGEVFDPDALNERNCVRGHTYTRDLSKEEDERNENLRSQIERGILRREDVPEKLKAVELDNASFLGSYNGKFIFTPYRRLTDDELADMLFLKDVQNQCEGLDLDLLERNARLAIHEAGYPLSATLYRMYSYTDRILSGREWKKKRIVSLTFSYSDEAGAAQKVYVYLDGGTGKVDQIEP